MQSVRQGNNYVVHLSVEGRIAAYTEELQRGGVTTARELAKNLRTQFSIAENVGHGLKVANCTKDANELATVLQETFGNLRGEQIKTTPKGFDKDHPGIDWLRYKQFILRHNFSDEQVLSPNFITEVNHTFQQLRPFFDYMSEVLTTNSNGEALV